MQPDKPRPKITIKRKPRKVEGVAVPEAEATEPDIEAGHSAGQVPTPATDEPERAEEQPPESELTAKQLKKQRRRERQAAEAALLAEAEAEAARVAEEQAEAERVAIAAAEEARIAKAREEKAARIAALTQEERAELERAKAEKAARMEAEKAAGFERRIEALGILDTNPIFHYFKPLAIGSDKELIAWAMKEGKGRLSGKAISDVIGAHCNHPHYLKKICLGGKRYSPLSGKAEGEVTPDQQAAAYDKLLGYDRQRKKSKQERLADKLPMNVEVLPEVLPSEETAEVLPETLPQGQEPLSSD